MSITLIQGDSLEALPRLAENSVHAILTDPPYGLSHHSVEDVVECLRLWLAGEPFRTEKTGFMGSSWDGWVPGPEIWRECLRVLKPGGMLLAFAGTRSMDLMSMAIRLAGFELRDSIGFAHDGGQAPLMAWVQAQGMPHGLDISRAIDKAAGAERKVIGTKVNTYDGCIRDPAKHGNPADQSHIGKWGLTKTPHGMPLTAPATPEAELWRGWNTDLRPSWEPIIMARKTLDGTVVQNVLKHGVGGINIDACRMPIDPGVDDPRLGGEGTWSTDKAAKNVYEGGYAGERTGSSPLGRYPANVIITDEKEVQAVFDAVGEKASGKPGTRRKKHETHSMSGRLGLTGEPEIEYGDKGSASRFFYCSKVSPKERGDSKHPTQKPITLMRYLARLICPPGGVILDPFAGSGTTGQACLDEGFDAILIEREAEFADYIRKRLNWFIDCDTTI